MDHKILKRESFYQGRAFGLERIQLILPDGRPSDYDLITHVGSVTIVPLDSDGNLYFVRQFRLGAGGPLLELPAGTLDEGEDPKICAGRELREEIGMGAKNLLELGDLFLAPGYSNEHMSLFLASGLYPSPLKGDKDEFLTKEVIPISKVGAMVRKNQIKDGKTLAALMLALPKLDKYGLINTNPQRNR
jgi:ADP-ribose pyrophosphatase